MPTKRLSALQRFRKATVRSFVRDRVNTKKAKAHAIKKAADKDAVAKWRVLRKIGVYESKDSPAVSRLTKARRRAIDTKFKAVQNLGEYDEGNVYRPLHKHEYTKETITYDSHGRIKDKKTRQLSRYELDKDHFQALNKKPAQAPSNSIPTKKGLLVGKQSNEKVTITKDGKVKTTETTGGAKTHFTREPLTGPVEFLQLIDDYKAGRLKFNKNEGLTIYSNGKRQRTYYGGAVTALIARLERYVAKGVRNFDDWSSMAEIAKVRRR